jgi:hypothetical protein
MLGLTEDSRDAVRLARSASEALGHDHVGTRHLLLGLVERDGLAATVLRSFGLDLDEVRERVRSVPSAHEEPNHPNDPGPRPVTKPAVIALAYGQQEAQVLGTGLADTEHVLLGLIRVATSHHDCGFARTVNFYDRLRIRNEILRLAARAPDPAHVARRKAIVSAPAGEFEAYAVGLLCDALKRMPADDASAIQRMTMRFDFEQDDRAQPVIEVRWNAAHDIEQAHGLDGHAVRIPPAGACAPQGRVLRRRWVQAVSGHAQASAAAGQAERADEVERALRVLGLRLGTLLHDTDVLWDVVGHSISTLVPGPSSPRDAHTASTE